MKEAAFVIYLALSSLLSVTLTDSGIHAKTGKYWLIFGSFMGAFLCGFAYGN